MTRTQFAAGLVVGILLLLLLPTVAMAQSAISGTVKDSSGAAMPGVTVEAASPALIERTRSVTTDGAGRYTIADLRPGEYTLTAAAPGFKTFKQEKIDVPADSSVPVFIGMEVGQTGETITVQAEAI